MIETPGKIVRFGDYNLISCTVDTASDKVISSFEQNTKSVFLHVNIYNYYKSFEKSLLSIGSYYNITMFFEGIGLKTLAFFSGKGINLDLNGTDMAPVLFDKLQINHKSIYILGASEDVLKRSISKLSCRYPELKICGSHHGYFNQDQVQLILKDINEKMPDLLIVGMGIEKELDFIKSSEKNLNIKAIWLVGGLFDFISGRLPRAPEIIRKARLEWLFRFVLEPRKKFGRNIIIPIKVIMNLVRTKK